MPIESLRDERVRCRLHSHGTRTVLSAAAVIYLTRQVADDGRFAKAQLVNAIEAEFGTRLFGTYRRLLPGQPCGPGPSGEQERLCLQAYLVFFDTRCARARRRPGRPARHIPGHRRALDARDRHGLGPFRRRSGPGRRSLTMTNAHRLKQASKAFDMVRKKRSLTS
jgi:hypothetical protein